MWSSTIGTSGSARATSVSCGICGWYSQASKVRPARPDRGQARAERRVVEDAQRTVPATVGGRPRERHVRIGRAQVANAAESALAGLDVRRQHVLDLGDRQVRVADDSGDERRGRVLLDHEVGLPDRLERDRSRRPPARAALDVHRAHDPVPGLGVSEVLRQLVLAAWQLPEVMVRIGDFEIGFEDLLHGPLSARGARMLPSARTAAALIRSGRRRFRFALT